MPSLTVNTFGKHDNSKQIKENPGKVYSLYYELTRTKNVWGERMTTYPMYLLSL